MLTHMFWAYENFNPINILCAKSFINKCYNLNVWTYGKIDNLPEGAILKDAREILPESEVFKCNLGSYANLSDLFSYAVLVEKGGLYTDCDVIALYSPNNIPKNNFFVSEHCNQVFKEQFFNLPPRNKIVLEELGPDIKISCCLFHSSKPNHLLLKAILIYALNTPKENFKWGTIGSKLITSFHKIYPYQNDNDRFIVMPSEFANPISLFTSATNKAVSDLLDVQFVQKCFFSDGIEFPKNSKFIHLCTSLWNQDIMKKYNESNYSKKSLIYKIKKFVEIGE